MQKVIERYQTISDLPNTGDSDFDTNETMYYNLKIKGFDDDDLSKFLSGLEEEELDYSDYVVDITKGGFDSEQVSNIKLMIDYMNKEGVTDPLTQIGVLSTIGKESNFKPQDEVCYNNTSNSRIRKIFGDRVSDLTEFELTDLKNDCKAFFNKVYGELNGNLGGDDGYNFRGRGFNGITGRGVYQKYGNLVGQNLLSNPEILNDDMDVAAAVAVAFFTNGVSTFPEFETKEEASEYFANKNAGLSRRSMFASNAMDYSRRFDVKPK
jgi:predicted chitinase